MNISMPVVLMVRFQISNTAHVPYPAAEGDGLIIWHSDHGPSHTCIRHAADFCLEYATKAFTDNMELIKKGTYLSKAPLSITACIIFITCGFRKTLRITHQRTLSARDSDLMLHLATHSHIILTYKYHSNKACNCICNLPNSHGRM
jgi:hypothetical protein